MLIMEEIRLNKHLAISLGVSRREADNLIAAGKVRIGDRVAELGARIHTDDIITVDGKPVTHKDFIYIMLNKPVNYVCSRKRQGDTPTIYELLPAELQELKSVGRLDKNSSGLILLTNDGDFAYQMTHPKFIKTKIYEVEIDRDLAPLHQQMIADFGVNLPDGRSQLGLMRLSDDNRRQWQVQMSEGRNRQIRRTFDALGYKVVALHRTDFGPYTLGNLEDGKYITVDKK